MTSLVFPIYGYHTVDRDTKNFYQAYDHRKISSVFRPI